MSDPALPVTRRLPPLARMISDALSDCPEAADYVNKTYFHYCHHCGGWIPGDAVRIDETAAAAGLEKPGLAQRRIVCRRFGHEIRVIPG